MTKNQKRDIATSLTTLVFLVVGTTGVMMYFHLFDKYTKDMHEILGLVFVGAVLLHVLFNFNSMKQYFKKKIFFLISAITLMTAVLFIVNAPEDKNPKRLILTTVINTTIDKSFPLFAGDMDLATIKLTEAGIKIDGAKSIREISMINNKSPFEIIRILNL
jgi:Na+/melibiose symporter-like transporter